MDNKKMTGSIARNPHQGTRSEYLAQYVFSGFGTSIPVPHPEDSGIDFYCTLGDEIGKRLIVDNYFVVQVKSNKDNIEYNFFESTKWLLSQKYPIIICVVNKKSGQIELFNTLHLARLYPNPKINKIIMQFSDPPDDIKDYIMITDNEIIIYLSKPILSFNISDLENEVNIADYKNKLKYWLEFDQNNINRKNIGINITLIPSEIKTNEIENIKLSLLTNFKEHKENNNLLTNTYYDNLLFILANEINYAVSKNDKERFLSLSDLSYLIIQNIKLTNVYGTVFLQTAINTGAKKMGTNNKMNVKINGINSNTDGVKIIG